MWTRRLSSAIVVIVFAIVFLCSWGCGSGSNSLYQMQPAPSSNNVKTDKYIIEVLKPPGKLEEVEMFARMFWEAPNSNAGVVVMETNSVVKDAISEDYTLSFMGEVPADSRVRITIWANFKEGVCHDPQDEFYCGPIQLYSNNQYYACSEKPALYDCKTEEIKVVLKASMQNAAQYGNSEYKCGEEVKESYVEPWQPRYCIYEPFDPLTF